MLKSTVNAHRVAGLQTVLAEVNARCTDDGLRADREAKIKEKQAKVAERQAELKEAQNELGQ